MVVPTKWIQTAQQTGLRLRDAGKVIAAGAAGAALVAGNVAQGFLGKASKTAANLSHKKPQEKEGVVKMKKSTVIALVIALAAVAGALVALYFYLMRREKELEEYEQLLFSEDEDDFLDAGDFDLTEEGAAESEA